MDDDTSNEKIALRTTMRESLAALPSMERAARSRRLIRRLVTLPAWREARRVLLFAPLAAEPDLDLLWSDGALAGKQVAYPRMEGAVLRLYFVAGLDEMEPTRWGLREPPVRPARETTLSEVDLVLVPALAFDAAGGRLGRGGGYYDRLLTLRDPAKTRLVGVSFAFQMIPEPLPLAAHDVKVDEVCTD